jgi:hypothetical protein
MFGLPRLQSFQIESNRISCPTEAGQEVRLFHPQQEFWAEHFDCSINGTLIVGMTDIGRVTITALRMNRPQLVEVRALWVDAGRHPPT